MCGIVGWIDWKRNVAEERATLESMTQTLTARGPDAEGYWLSSEAAFGHRRLAVVDILGGAQPMVRKRQGHIYVLTYNGELYNTEELRRELLAHGYGFQGHSDTEVLLTAYLEWGPRCIERFNGIFAFGIWNAERKELFLARDRLGVKPLFYAATNTRLLFASELKALLAHPDIESRVDAEGLSEVLFLGPARTPGVGIYRGVQELKPGHALLFSPEGLKTYAYWVLPSREHTDDFQTTVQTVRELFIDSVQRQLVSDVPIGTLLSGGLDSSAISAIAAAELERTGKGPLATFSVDYLDNEKYFQANAFQPNSDRPWIDRVSAILHTQHTYTFFDTPELAQALTAAVEARDLPGMADIDTSLLLFSREIKHSVTVALSGECADEVFGGYPWFHRQDALAATTFPWALNNPNRLQILSPELLARLRPEEYVQQRYAEALAELPVSAKESRTLPPAEKARETRMREIAYLTLTRFMPVLLERKDRMSMASGLEVRVPFCDHRLVEYVWNIPWSIKSHQGREKALLRLALDGLLPEDVLWRKKSPYPKTHHPAYLQAVTVWLEDILANPNSPLLPLVNLPALRKLIQTSATLPAGHPWFGQLMDIPQLFAYLIQVEHWLKSARVTLS